MGASDMGGGRFLVRWAEDLGSPTIRGDVQVPELGVVVLDDADIHYAQTTPNATFFVKRSAALGEGRFVVVGRVHPA